MAFVRVMRMNPTWAMFYPRAYLFSLFIFIGVLIIPRLLNVTFQPRAPPWMKESHFPDDFKQQYTYIPFLRILLRHSHHSPGSIGFQHELCFKNKCVCTGCYGTSSGIFFSIFLIGFHLLRLWLENTKRTANSVIKEISSFKSLSSDGLHLMILAWALFGVFLMKYRLDAFKKPMIRLFLNFLLPISITTYFIGLDLIFRNVLVLTLNAVLFFPLILLRVLLTRFEEESKAS